MDETAITGKIAMLERRLGLLLILSGVSLSTAAIALVTTHWGTQSGTTVAKSSASASTVVADRIEAREIVVKDENGRVRVKVSSESASPAEMTADPTMAIPYGAGLQILDEGGTPKAAFVTDGWIVVGDKKKTVAGLQVTDLQTQLQLQTTHLDVELDAFESADWMNATALVSRRDWSRTASLNVSAPYACLSLGTGQDKKDLIQACSNDGGPSIDLHDDDENLRAALGTTQLVTAKTGEGTTTAPSSLTLFDKSGHVISRAP